MTAASVGGALRSARNRQGRTIAEVAEELCITQGYVRAIEEDDIERLPGIFFYKSFVKQYASLLGVDVSLIDPVIVPLTPREEVSTPQAESTDRFHFAQHPLGLSVAGLAVVLALCSGFYAWWSGISQGAYPARATYAVATQSARPEIRPPAPSTSQSAHAIPISKAPLASEYSEATDSRGVEYVVLHLSAREATWIRVTSDGRTIFSGMLQPSESKELKSSNTAIMKVGNAAGIDIRLNGKPIGPLGPHGQVRTVRFTPENFEILPPTDTDKVGTSAEPKTL